MAFASNSLGREIEASWRSLVIERTDGTLGNYGDVAAPLQCRFLNAVRPALEYLASGGESPPTEVVVLAATASRRQQEHRWHGQTGQNDLI